MGKRKRTPEEREELRRLKAEWARNAEEFRAMYERLKERWRLEDERRARRRRLLRRMFPFAR